MKFFGSRFNLVVPILIVCCLAGVGGSVALAQTPTSGAMLTINGSVGTGAAAVQVNRTIYDSQIHTGGTVKQVFVGGGSSCTSTDQLYPTDAYVLQGGSWTGCDQGDAYETSQGTGTAAIKGTGYEFDITTQYLINGEATYCTSAGVSPNICANPDSGFLTVTNNSGAAFTGTITLSGTAMNVPEGNQSYCPATGSVSDTLTSGLASTASATFALSTDSSNCGGYNAPQTQTLVAGQTSTFLIGSDDYKITPANSTAGDTLTLLPIPVPAGPTTTGSHQQFPASGSAHESLLFPTTTSTPTSCPSAASTFTASFCAPLFPGQTSIPYTDLSAVGNPVGLEFQLSCTPAPLPAVNDCSTFLYTTEINFTIDTDSLPNGPNGQIGGPQFLGEHDGSPAGYLGQCPTTGFNIDIFTSFGGGDLPLRGGGGGNSCFVGTFDPTATPVQTATQHTFVGFYLPVSDTHLNYVEDGLPVPLIWQTLDTTGKPVKNLTLCNNINGTNCKAPWVFVGMNAISCTNDQLEGAPQATTAIGGLLNFSILDGIYAYNMKTTRGSTGCFTPVLKFSTGLISYSVANFKFI